ncbi:MAG: hypothetical protein HC875_40875 [Anaerolineales bacterium]|nr:hypothetical protein [Anaerolineales bacterium]
MARKKDKTLIEEAIENIRADRASAADVLERLISGVSSTTDFRDVAVSCTKALETLQRSNEQLVKLATAKTVQVDEEDFSLSKEEEQKLFEDLKKPIN